MSGKQYLDELLSNLNAFAGISQDRIAAIVEYVAEIERAAALSVPAAAVVGEPEGGKLVPIVPTPEMLVDIAKACRDFFSEDGPYPRARAVYRATISAAPEPNLAGTIQILTAERDALLAERDALIASRNLQKAVAEGQSIKWASEMTDEEIVAELAVINDRIDAGFGDGGGSPGEWYYERSDELAAEKSRREAKAAKP